MIKIGWNGKMNVKDNKRNKIVFFICFIAICISFDINIIKVPFVFAEDSIFINDAITDGFNSITYRHAAYLEIIPRLIANIAVFIGKTFQSYYIVTKVMQILTIILDSYFLLVFYFEDFSWICKSKKIRFSFCVVFLLWMSNFFNTMYTSVYIHWFAEFYVFLIGLNYIKGKKVGVINWFVLPVVLLNSPEASIVLFPMVLYSLYQVAIVRKIEKIYLVICSYCLIAILQIILLFGGGYDTSINSIASNNISSILGNTITMVMRVPTLLFSNKVVEIIGFKASIFLGILMWIVIIIAAFYFEIVLEIIYSLFFISAHFFLVSVKFDWGTISADNWVYCMPCISVMVVGILLVSKFKQRTKITSVQKHIVLIMFACICISEASGMLKIGYIDYTSTRYIDYYPSIYPVAEYEDRIDFSSKEYEVVTEGVWQFLIPIRK